MFDSNASKKPGENPDFQKKIILFVIIVIAVFFPIILRLGTIQIVKNISYENKTKQNRERIYKVVPPRGQIYFSDGKLLATNNTSFNLYINQSELYKDRTSRQNELLLICEILNYNYSDLENNLKEKPKTTEILIQENISFSQIGKIKESSDNLPGINIREVLYRNYPNKQFLSHVIGYIGPINSNELAMKAKSGYQHDDYIGKDGLEMYYEDYLRGKPGEKVYQIDARMIIQDELENKEKKPVPGDELILTINYELQKAAEDILADRSGTIIALRPSTGEILAMASYPGFDPNIYILNNEENNKKKIDILLDTKYSPMINRAIKSKYPAASIFKLATTTAILKENILPVTQQFYCSGNFRLNNEYFKCWVYPANHGWENLTEAITNSCDIYFYNAGLAVGPERIYKYATMYGFGNLLNIDLPNEEKGLIPSPEWMKNKGSLWLPGNTLNTTIGQGNVQVTPMQIANFLSVICNKGYSYRPHILKEIRSPIDGTLVKEVKSEKIIDITSTIEESTFDFIHNALRDVVIKGTASRAFLSNPYKIAGKTGTAEVGTDKDKKQAHSWFVGFGPVDYPKEIKFLLLYYANMKIITFINFGTF